MEAASPAPTARRLGSVLALAALAGALLRVAMQIGRPFIGDELGTLRALAQPYEYFLTNFKGQLTMNHYVAFLRALRDTFGDSAWVLVLPSLAAANRSMDALVARSYP